MEKKLYWNIAGFIFLAGAFFAGFMVYTNLDKGLIFNDEAFYLFHFREYKNILTVDATNFFRIFQGFYTENIYHFRLITYFLLNFSTFILFFLTARYFKLKTNPLWIGALGVAFNFLTWNASNIVLHQYIGNTILINFSLFFLISTLQNKKNYLLIFSGFFLGILLFDGIPHASVVAPVVLFLLFNFWKNHKKNILIFFVGILLAIGFYFGFIQKFSNFVEQFEYLKIYQQFHTKQHPKSFYVFWMAKVLGFLFVPGFLSVFIIHRFVKDKIKTLNIIIAVFAVITLISVLIYPFIYLNYFLLFLLIYRYIISDKEIEKKSFLVLLFCIPFCLAFGSGAYFDTRGDAYFIYYILALVIVLNNLYPIKYYWVFTAFFVFQIFLFPKQFKEKGWKDFVFSEQTEPVKINGYNLYLDKGRKKDIEDLRPYLQNQKKIIYSSNHLMGYLFILNAKPPIPYYFALKNYVEFIIEKKDEKPDDYIYLESNDYPFDGKEIIPLKFVNHPEKYKIVKAGRFTLYLPENFQKK